MPQLCPTPFLIRTFFSALVLLTPTLLLAQAEGPQHVPIPPTLTKPSPGKHKIDRSILPPVPVFRDVAKQLGVTAAAGPTRKGWGMGIAVADYDNDGKLDLFVTGYSGSVLYRNLGNCKFEDVTDKAGLRGSGFMTGAAWGDYDRDGYVDLFVSRYTHLDLNNLPPFGGNKFCRFKGILVQCGPWGLEGESDFLYHNRGDGTFEEVSVKAGVHDDIGYYGLGVMWV